MSGEPQQWHHKIARNACAKPGGSHSMFQSWALRHPFHDDPDHGIRCLVATDHIGSVERGDLLWYRMLCSQAFEAPTQRLQGGNGAS